MAHAITEHMKYKAYVNKIDYEQHIVKCASGEMLFGENIITTIPWKELKKIQGMPLDIKESIKKLKCNSVDIEYQAKDLETDAHWMYYPNKNL